MQQASSQQSQSAGDSGAAGELRSDAKKIGSTAADRLHSEVDARKSAAADQAKTVSSAIERAAGDLGEDTPNWLKSAFQQGAEQIQRFAQTLEQKDSRQMLNDVQDFARERPGTFLAACAAAGFAASRIFKAGSDQQTSGSFSQDRQPGSSSSFDQGQPWGNGERTLPGSDQQFRQEPPLGQSDFQDAGTPNSRRGEFV